MIARRSTCRRLILVCRRVPLALPVLAVAACAIAMAWTAAPSARAAEIRHRMLIGDESRAQLLYVDQQDPSKDWVLKLPARYRDLQLVGGGRVMMNTPDGYREYRLSDRAMIKEVKGYPGAMSARRLPDGRTVLGCAAQGVTVYELAADDKLLRKANFKAGSLRLLRLTPQNTFLFGCNQQVFEGDWSGKPPKTLALKEKEGAWIYQALRKPDGHLLVSAGYNPCVLELDPEGHVLKKFGGKDGAGAKELGYHFFAGFQVLANGNLVVSNWSGHGAGDSSKGVQLIEYTPAEQIVWKWHDASRAGSIHGIIVLDDLDASVLNDDVSGVLGPVK